MNWNKKEVIPPLSKRAIAMGNTDGGTSIPLLFKHASGRVSFGLAVLHAGEVAWWYAGEIGDDCWSPEPKDAVDPIVEWAECPTAEMIVAGLMGAVCLG